MIVSKWNGNRSKPSPIEFFRFQVLKEGFNDRVVLWDVRAGVRVSIESSSRNIEGFAQQVNGISPWVLSVQFCKNRELYAHIGLWRDFRSLEKFCNLGLSVKLGAAAGIFAFDLMVSFGLCKDSAGATHLDGARSVRIYGEVA